MNLIDKLKSDKTIEETVHYGNNSSGTQGSVFNDSYVTSDRNNEIEKRPLLPLTAEAIQPPLNPMELAQQELKDNRLVLGVVKTRDELRKLEEKNALEYGLNQLRYEMGFRNIIPIPEGPGVVTSFPLESFPDWAARLVSKIAQSLQVPIEAVAPALIGAMLIGARGNYVIEVKKDYQELLTAFIVVVMVSGGRKSAIVNYFRKIFNEIEAARQIDFDVNATSRKSSREALIAIKRKVKSKILAKVDFESLDEIKDATKQLGETLEIIERETQQLKYRPKLLIDSPTSKELSMEMARQDEAIGIFEAEGGIWKHRVRPSEDNIYLKGFTGEPFGDETTAGSVNMRRPCLSICTYVQGVVAEKLYSNDALKCDGLLPRILPVFVSSNHGY